MDKINVVWLSYHEPDVIARGYWDQGLLEDIFNRGNFEHHINFATDSNPKGYMPNSTTDGAVVVINGRTHVEDVDKINADLARLRWVVFIETGDEEALFPIQEIKHPLLRVWVMLPRMNLHNDVSYKMPNGYRPDTRPLLKRAGEQGRIYDYFFAGQINHARREQCIEAAKALENQNGILVTTDGFGKEVLPYSEYISKMAQSKIVFCPSGIESPDNFRLYEALEAGCLPIVDAFATNNQAWGFWQYLFGSDMPFPVIPYWSDLPTLLPELLKDYPANANRASAWWQLVKRNMFNKLIDDITEVSK